MMPTVRIGTWNLAGRWSDEHRTLILTADCDVWLLTEVSERIAVSAGLDALASRISVEREGKRLSDHDAYVVEVTL